MIHIYDYTAYIEGKKEYWTGKTVLYAGEKYKVIDVDYNGALLIDKKAQFTDTTAVLVPDVKEVA